MIVLVQRLWMSRNCIWSRTDSLSGIVRGLCMIRYTVRVALGAGGRLPPITTIRKLCSRWLHHKNTSKRGDRSCFQNLHCFRAVFLFLFANHSDTIYHFIGCPTAAIEFNQWTIVNKNVLQANKRGKSIFARITENITTFEIVHKHTHIHTHIHTHKRRNKKPSKINSNDESYFKQKEKHWNGIFGYCKHRVRAKECERERESLEGCWKRTSNMSIARQKENKIGK